MPNLEAVIAKLDGLKELIDLKFDANDKHHTEMKAKQDYTNGKVRMHEKIIWLGGGAVLITGIPKGVELLINFLA